MKFLAFLSDCYPVEILCRRIEKLMVCNMQIIPNETHEQSGGV